MKLKSFFTVLLLVSTVFSVLAPQNPLHSRSAAQLTYQVHAVGNSRVHTLLIPRHGNYQVKVAQADNLADLKTFARKHQAFALVNGGFFDPKNGKTTSFIRQNGKIVADPRQNERLMYNPTLKDSLPQILNRSEWRRYQCQGEVRYAITYHQEPTPAGCQLRDALGAGPRLLPDLTAAKEAFVSFRQGQMEKDALGIDQPNARSAIAITAKGDLIWIMVEQKPRAENSGLSLVELAQFLRKLGAVSALNLDGGSSAAFYYQGNVVYGKVDSEGKKVERPVKSVLWLEKI